MVPDKTVRVTSDNRDGLAILSVTGALVFDETLPVLRKSIVQLLEAGFRRFIMDVSNVTHCDSSGCSEIIRVYISVYKSGGVLVFLNPSPRLRTLWVRIRLIDVFLTFENLESAKAFVNGRPDA